VSTTALSLVDTRLPLRLLTAILRVYLTYFRLLTGATLVEVYATEVQEAAIQRLGLGDSVTSYHVPWQKEVRNLARLAGRPHPHRTTATIHAFEWANHFNMQEAGKALDQSQAALEAFVRRTTPVDAELDLLDQAADNGLAILFETVVDRELYAVLQQMGKSREEYLFERVDYVRRLRDAWLNRHGDSESTPMPPVGIVLNPWHAAVEMRGDQITAGMRMGTSSCALRESLLPLLIRYVDTMEGLVCRFYAGNSRPWELRLPEALQRGHFLDPHGVIPELELLRSILRDQPEIANAVTLEASPQSAMLSGRLATTDRR